MSGVGVATLVRLEAGTFNPRLTTQRKLADSLGVSIDHLSQGREAMASTAKGTGTKKPNYQKEATEASRKLKKELSAVWKKHFPRLKGADYNWRLEEIESAYSHLQLLLRNEQTAGY